MSEDILQKAEFQGVTVDLLFEGEQPGFGDLFLIRGFEHPFFEPEGDFNFSALADLEFDQVDDFWAVSYESGNPTIWLYPLIDGHEVYHHEGPFSGLRLDYGILDHPVRNIPRFLKIISTFARHLPVNVTYPLRGISLGNPPDLTILESDINTIVAHWRAKGIEPGSSEARRIAVRGCYLP